MTLIDNNSLDGTVTELELCVVSTLILPFNMWVGSETYFWLTELNSFVSSIDFGHVGLR